MSHWRKKDGGRANRKAWDTQVSFLAEGAGNSTDDSGEVKLNLGKCRLARSAGHSASGGGTKP